MSWDDLKDDLKPGDGLRSRQETDARRYWDKKRLRNTRVRDAYQTHISVVGMRLQVVCPYHPDFPGKAARLGGRWRKRTGFWTFPYDNRMDVLNAIRDTFGPILSSSWEQTRVELMRAYLTNLAGGAAPAATTDKKE